MGQLLGGAFDEGWQPLGQSWAPLADLSETDEAYLAEVELPGVAKDDISVELAGAAGKAAASGGSLHVVSGRYQVRRPETELRPVT